MSLNQPGTVGKDINPKLDFVNTSMRGSLRVDRGMVSRHPASQILKASACSQSLNHRNKSTKKTLPQTLNLNLGNQS